MLAVGVGRFVPSKRFSTLVAAATTVSDLGVVLVGAGPLDESLREAARAHAVEDRVWLTGPLFDDDLADALGAADILCSPSEYEGFGLTLIEGMACGLPVVAHAVGGVTDIVEDGVTGRLLETSDPAVWASALGALAAQRDERLRLGAAGACAGRRGVRVGAVRRSVPAGLRARRPPPALRHRLSAGR